MQSQTGNTFIASVLYQADMSTIASELFTQILQSISVGVVDPLHSDTIIAQDGYDIVKSHIGHIFRHQTQAGDGDSITYTRLEGLCRMFCGPSVNLLGVQTRLSNQTGKEILEGTAPKLVGGAHCPPEQAPKETGTIYSEAIVHHDARVMTLMSRSTMISQILCPGVNIEHLGVVGGG
jgi:hypothetical protein